MTRVVVTVADPIPAHDLSLRPAKNLNVGLTQFAEHFPRPSSLEVDLLTVAAAVYCADIGIKRGEREDVAREIRLTIPVTNLAAFNAVKSTLQYALTRLSYDGWKISFTQRDGTPEAAQQWDRGGNGRVLLFSGGLDSLAAAIRFGGEGANTILVSHVTANRTVTTAQDEVAAYLDTTFAGQFERMAFRVGGRSARAFPFPSDQEREESQRTRSFLFLSLAALVARRRGLQEVVVIAENGQMAIHLPLSAARIGAFSTQTAHPEVLSAAADLFSALLQSPIRITNPFLYLTKAEVVHDTVAHHAGVLRSAISCWKASRVPGALNHCGFCIPCLIRRIAIEHNGAAVNEYARDLLSEDVSALPPDDEGKRNLVELAEFIGLFRANRNRAEMEHLFPELVTTKFDAGQTIDMYRRFAGEAVGVLGRYPSLAFLTT
jgi:7-cyano-7-deazaguanine synthase in queuosine biosynthesis